MSLSKNIIKKIISWAGILVLGFFLGTTIKFVTAWVEPNQMPPGGNIAAPLNTGNIGQIKQGGLILNIGGAQYGLIVDKGSVGIKTTNPTKDLDVNGAINASAYYLNGAPFEVPSATLTCTTKTNSMAPQGTISVNCDSGYIATGGGCNTGSPGSDNYAMSYPIGTPPNGWTCRSNDNGVTVYVVCCKL